MCYTRYFTGHLIWRSIGGICALLICEVANAAEYGINSKVSTQTAYNTNIFMTTGPHEPVSSASITPEVMAFIKDNNWRTDLAARLHSSKYSNHDFDTNDQRLSLDGNYRLERNVFDLATSYELTSNLSSESADFGVTAKRVNRKNTSWAPSYTWLFSDRMSVSTSFVRTDTAYQNSTNTGLVDYNLDTTMLALNYSVTERDQLSISYQFSDYASKDGSIQYQNNVYRVGISHQFSEQLTGNFQVGASKTDSTNLNTTETTFFGTQILRVQEIDYVSRGFVLNAGMTYNYETGSAAFSLSRDDVANSTGGLSQVDAVSFNVTTRLSDAWSYSVNTSYVVSTAVSASSQSSDREIFQFSPVLNYAWARQWRAYARFSYTQRKFRNDLGGGAAPHSEAITLGMTYNFPSISTF